MSIAETFWSLRPGAILRLGYQYRWLAAATATCSLAQVCKAGQMGYLWLRCLLSCRLLCWLRLMGKRY
ncbi:MAG: hypothetical protein HGA19_07775 [Oscillochloris sp.]|nr:hypothetical protein [Oscillochloris sp.]